MVIGFDGKKLGIMSLDAAINIAEESKHDLVQVSSPEASPIVCKVMDYGKHVFDKKKTFLHLKVR